MHLTYVVSDPLLWIFLGKFLKFCFSKQLSGCGRCCAGSEEQYSMQFMLNRQTRASTKCRQEVGSAARVPTKITNSSSYHREHTCLCKKPCLFFLVRSLWRVLPCRCRKHTTHDLCFWRTSGKSNNTLLNNP